MNSPSREEIANLIQSAGITRGQFAIKLAVHHNTVDQWLASESAKYRATMPSATWELAKILFGHPDAIAVMKA